MDAKKVPWKVLRYFPLMPRLQRLFMSLKIAPDMRWHHENWSNDEVLRHPTDAEAWKSFDQTHESFSSDPRNVRLELATNGFNPFGDMSISYSCWPVDVFPYNIPPWMCMKEPYLFMSLLIPGQKGPGNDIDVFLRPLIDELKELWENGAETYDALTQENFQMRVALMWTINDFPVYAYTSGWSTQGNLACPCCGSETSHRRLKHGSKMCYMGHRRFLPPDHKWRSQKAQFDGKRERKGAPKRLFGDDVLNQLDTLPPVTLGKAVKRKRLPGRGKSHNWKKHNAMHIEKNICDSVMGTILDIDKKSKDSLNARLNLKMMSIWKELHPEDGKTAFPRACYTLSKDEKKAHPEGSIVERYMVDECLTFCSRYLIGIETIFNRPERNDDRCPTTCDNTPRLPIFSRRGHPSRKSVVRELNNTDYYAASLYVLQNCDEIKPLVQEHGNILVDLSVNVDEMHRHEFICSFKERITKLYNDGNEQVDEHMQSLAWGPNKRATHYPCYNVNGFRFHTKQRDDAREGIGYKLDRHGITSINRTPIGEVKHVPQATNRARATNRAWESPATSTHEPLSKSEVFDGESCRKSQDTTFLDKDHRQGPSEEEGVDGVGSQTTSWRRERQECFEEEFRLEAREEVQEQTLVGQKMN
ncbi:uncharacterized protein LOC142624962 [Castanea sativa]|uniref:uncharacterized protein LOC142624962 n=1 Tax=Castanea sativa TaxID=21020 RepID=UPI003F64F11C